MDTPQETPVSYSPEPKTILDRAPLAHGPDHHLAAAVEGHAAITAAIEGHVQAATFHRRQGEDAAQALARRD